MIALQVVDLGYLFGQVAMCGGGIVFSTTTNIRCINFCVIVVCGDSSTISTLTIKNEDTTFLYYHRNEEECMLHDGMEFLGCTQ
jgi:hypothetical protein